MTDEERFRTVFGHLGRVAAYARRRGSRDPEALAAEVMAIAWRRLDVVPRDDALPWLYRTAHNLLLAERRVATASSDVPEQPAFDAEPLDPGLARALRALSPTDCEALLLVAWEDLTPSQAARAVGITAPAFRVRLLRARRRFQALYAADSPPITRFDVEEA